MLYNGYVYETFGISESKPVKPLQFSLYVIALKLVLSAKCFIYFVRCWALYIFNHLRSFHALIFVLSGSAIFPCVWEAILFDKFWLRVGFLCDLAMCMALSVGIFGHFVKFFLFSLYI